ncbi:hypothetical protein SGFS_047260 [Streptomyces graminofaciens]|uniref:Uncharacterized protein n=1 Tax=Streptomyces graminofaciens TaxID=68212 RepID=A0ABN5VJ52_9ACTN|nr:hypothetical protein [Streptomyces graminofaciens]BBC33432.1 hypothetical protein SGFS_047260 [Streptomyces graminofaciens]
MPAPRTAPPSAPETARTPRTAEPPADPCESAPSPDRADTATDVVRWAAFSCVLVPVVLVWYGTSLAGAAGAALGLAAVTGVCRVLLRQSERGAARLLAEERPPHRGRHGRTGSGAHRGGRHPGPGTPGD